METNVRIWEMVAQASLHLRYLAREIEERDKVIEAQRARIAELEKALSAMTAERDRLLKIVQEAL